MKTIEEKVAVYRAWLEGKTIQIAHKGKDVWYVACAPTWDWRNFDYTVEPEPVKPEPVKPAVAKAYTMPEGYVFWTIAEPLHPYENSTRAPEFDIVAKEVP